MGVGPFLRPVRGPKGPKERGRLAFPGGVRGRDAGARRVLHTRVAPNPLPPPCHPHRSCSGACAPGSEPPLWWWPTPIGTPGAPSTCRAWMGSLCCSHSGWTTATGRRHPQVWGACGSSCCGLGQGQGQCPWGAHPYYHRQPRGADGVGVPPLLRADRHPPRPPHLHLTLPPGQASFLRRWARHCSVCTNPSTRPRQCHWPRSWPRVGLRRASACSTTAGARPCCRSCPVVSGGPPPLAPTTTFSRSPHGSGYGSTPGVTQLGSCRSRLGFHRCLGLLGDGN